MILYPIQHAMSPKNRLTNIYNNEKASCEPRRSRMFSLMNVENVVNPPQKPVIKISFKCGSPGISFENKPMRKQPATLATKVPMG